MTGNSYDERLDPKSFHRGSAVNWKVGIILGLIFVVFATNVSVLTAEEITSSEAAAHVGQKATVCGIVASATFAFRTKGQPTFLNFDQPHPRQVFTAVIWGSDRGQFDPPPEQAFKGRRVCVTGLVKLYREKPEIVVRLPSQIKEQ